MRKIQLDKRYRKLAIAGVILALLFVAFVAWGIELSPYVQAYKPVLLVGIDSEAGLGGTAVPIGASSDATGGQLSGALYTLMQVGDRDSTAVYPVQSGVAVLDTLIKGSVATTPYVAADDGTLYRAHDAGGSGDNKTAGIPATGGFVFDGVNFDRARSSAVGDAQTVGIPAGAGYVYNGASMDRARGAGADALAATGLPIGALYGYNGASWDRVRTSSVPAEIGMLKVVSVAPTYAYKNMYSTDNVVVVKSGAGTLHTISLNTSASLETITWTVYDSTSAAGAKIATIYVPESWPNTLTYDVEFTTGLTIQASPLGGGASNITVSYK